MLSIPVINRRVTDETRVAGFIHIRGLDKGAEIEDFFCPRLFRRVTLN